MPESGVFSSQAESLCKSALDALASHIAVLNSKGEIIGVNQPWRNFAEENNLSWPDCGVGKNYIAVCEAASGPDADMSRAIGNELRRLLEGASFCLRQMYSCHSPGHRRWFEMYASTFQNQGQTYMVVTHRNITARKLAEEQLVAHHAAVEAVVARRTRELGIANAALQDEVRERQKYEHALLDADRRKDDFLAMLAHELRNPLGPIRNSALVLERLAPADSGLQPLRGIIERQIGYIVRLVDDLMDVSRIGRGKMLLRKEPLDLMQLLRVTAEDHRCSLEAGGIRLDVELPAEPLWVSGDSTRLAQAVGNLLHNAAKFTDSGGRVGLSAQGRAGGDVLVTVSDTGAGIDPAMLDHIFDLFRQDMREAGRSRGGLGLGLALVKGLVELHGGTVSAFSEGRGCGARFCLTLPLIPKPEPAPPSAERPAGECIKHRVLVIEDSYDAAESMRMLLELDGHQVAVAFSGNAGDGRSREDRNRRPKRGHHADATHDGHAHHQPCQGPRHPDRNASSAR